MRARWVRTHRAASHLRQNHCRVGRPCACESESQHQAANDCLQAAEQPALLLCAAGLLFGMMIIVGRLKDTGALGSGHLLHTCLGRCCGSEATASSCCAPLQLSTRLGRLTGRQGPRQPWKLSPLHSGEPVQHGLIRPCCPDNVPGMFELMSAVAVRLSRGKMWALSLMLM